METWPSQIPSNIRMVLDYTAKDLAEAKEVAYRLNAVRDSLR
jgi:hypothetical protein